MKLSKFAHVDENLSESVLYRLGVLSEDDPYWVETCRSLKKFVFCYNFVWLLVFIFALVLGDEWCQVATSDAAAGNIFLARVLVS
jgi:hypothetical protein